MRAFRPAGQHRRFSRLRGDDEKPRVAHPQPIGHAVKRVPRGAHRRAGRLRGQRHVAHAAAQALGQRRARAARRVREMRHGTWAAPPHPVSGRESRAEWVRFGHRAAACARGNEDDRQTLLRFRGAAGELGAAQRRDGAGDRTRTGKPIKAADFRHTASFEAGAARRRSCAGLCLRRRARALLPLVRLRRPPSSLYTFPAAAFATASGLARRCLGASRARGFAEFEGFCTGRFRPGTQSFKSAMFTNFITPARADRILPPLRPPQYAFAPR